MRRPKESPGPIDRVGLSRPRGPECAAFRRSLCLVRLADYAINRVDELTPWVAADQLRAKDCVSACVVKAVIATRLRSRALTSVILSLST
ncbi:protein of unknown function (plasmid) [Pararobbsia alpina]